MKVEDETTQFDIKDLVYQNVKRNSFFPKCYS